MPTHADYIYMQVINVPMRGVCGSCNGTGGAPGAKVSLNRALNRALTEP
jgi:hypothetical protein